MRVCCSRVRASGGVGEEQERERERERSPLTCCQLTKLSCSYYSGYIKYTRTLLPSPPSPITLSLPFHLKAHLSLPSLFGTSQKLHLAPSLSLLASNTPLQQDSHVIT